MRRTFATTLTGFSFLGALVCSYNLGCSGTVLTSDPGGHGGDGADAGGGPVIGPGPGSSGGEGSGPSGGSGGGAGSGGSSGNGGGGGGPTLGQPDAGAGASYGTLVFDGTEGGPGWLFTDDVNVYWTQGGPAASATGAIWSAALNGSSGMPAYVATLAAANNDAPPPYLIIPAICAETIYWPDVGAGAIQSCFAGGCDSPSVVPGTQGATTVLCDDANLYWVNQLDQLLACARSGCSTPTVLTRTSGMSWVSALDGNTIVFQDDNGVSSCPTTGCASPTRLTAQQPGLGVAAANGMMFWTANGEILGCSDTACGTPTVLARESTYLDSVVTDGVNVYWSDIVQPASPSEQPSGNIWKCAVGGCGGSPTKLVASPRLVNDIILSSQSVVWSGSGEKIGEGWVWVTPK